MKDCSRKRFASVGVKYTCRRSFSRYIYICQSSWEDVSSMPNPPQSSGVNLAFFRETEFEKEPKTFEKRSLTPILSRTREGTEVPSTTPNTKGKNEILSTRNPEDPQTRQTRASVDMLFFKARRPNHPRTDRTAESNPAPDREATTPVPEEHLFPAFPWEASATVSRGARPLPEKTRRFRPWTDTLRGPRPALPRSSAATETRLRHACPGRCSNAGTVASTT